MGKYYHNAVKVNNGLVLDGQTPIDDRFVFESIKDLFIDPASPQLCELHTNAYRGLTVACMGDETGAETGGQTRWNTGRNEPLTAFGTIEGRS